MQGDRRSFLRALIGKPYALGASGPDFFDCYGLARHVLRTLYALNLPADRHEQVARRDWKRTVIPVEGAVVIMGQGDKHIGVWVAGGVLHAMSGLGVVFDDLHTLHFRGLGRIRMYIPA